MFEELREKWEKEKFEIIGDILKGVSLNSVGFLNCEQISVIILA